MPCILVSCFHSYPYQNSRLSLHSSITGKQRWLGAWENSWFPVLASTPRWSTSDRTGAGSRSAEPVSRDGSLVWEDVVGKAGSTVTWLYLLRYAFSVLLLHARHGANTDARKTTETFFCFQGPFLTWEDRHIVRTCGRARAKSRDRAAHRFPRG